MAEQKSFKVKLPSGQLVTVKAASAEEAAKGARLYMARENAGKARGKNDFQSQATRSASLGLQDITNAGIGAVLSQAPRLVGKDPGYGLGEAFTAARGVEKQRADEYARDKPVRNITGGLLGGLMAPGGKQAAGFIAKGTNLGTKALRSALVGAGYGGLFGGATAEPGQELRGASEGAAIGGVTGGAVPVAAATASKVVSAPARTALRAANRMSGGRLLNADAEAAKRLAAAMKADGLDAAEIQAGLNAWMKSGASSPALLDLLPPGGKAQGLVRAAAVKSGPAQVSAQKYREGVATDLQDRVIDRTRRLVPSEQRPAQQLADELAETRSRLASEQYAQPYAQPVQPVEATQQALGGSAGRAALQRARSAAEARMDVEQVAEIDSLLRGETNPVSAATLDRIKIAMGERADKAARAGANDMRSGLTARTGMIDESLEGVPGLQDARGVYRNMTNQIEAIPEGGKVLSQQPDEFIYTLEQRLKNAVEAGEVTLEQAQQAIRNASQVGAARSIEGAVGAPTEGATGVLNRLSSGTNTGRNLGALFGEEEAQAYRQAVANEAKRLQNARYIDQSMNSKTSGVLADEQLVEAPKIRVNPLELVTGVINKVRQGATLTDAEREALVTMVTAEVNQGSPALQALKPAQPGALSRYSDQAVIPLAIEMQRRRGQ